MFVINVKERIGFESYIVYTFFHVKKGITRQINKLIKPNGNFFGNLWGINLEK